MVFIHSIFLQCLIYARQYASHQGSKPDCHNSCSQVTLGPDGLGTCSYTHRSNQSVFSPCAHSVLETPSSASLLHHFLFSLPCRYFLPFPVLLPSSFPLCLPPRPVVPAFLLLVSLPLSFPSSHFILELPKKCFYFVENICLNRKCLLMQIFSFINFFCHSNFHISVCSPKKLVSVVLEGRWLSCAGRQESWPGLCSPA